MNLDNIPSKDRESHKSISPNTSVKKTIMGITAGVALLVGNQACGGKNEEVQTNSTDQTSSTTVQTVPSATQEPQPCFPTLEDLQISTDDSHWSTPEQEYKYYRNIEDMHIPGNTLNLKSRTPEVRLPTNMFFRHSDISVQCVDDPSRKFNFFMDKSGNGIAVKKLSQDPQGNPLPPDKDSCDDKGGYQFTFDLGR